MGKAKRRPRWQRWLALGALTPVLAGGCASSCPTCGSGFIAEGPASPPPYTYVYSEGPGNTTLQGVVDGSGFLATVDVPPARTQITLAARNKPQPRDIKAIVVTSNVEPEKPKPVEIVQTDAQEDLTPPVQLPVAHSQPLPRPASAQPPAKVESMWTEEALLEAMKQGSRGSEPVVAKAREAAPAPAPAPVPAPAKVEAAPTDLKLVPDVFEMKPLKAEVEPPKPAMEPVEHLVNGYGHAEDYTWLAGEVQVSRGKGYRLRYAGFDESDQYGGSVTLMDDPKLESLQDGQFIKVRGRIINPEGKAIAPPFRVDSLEVQKP